MKILKRNQIIVSVLALMLITVGYMTYTSNMQNAVETGALMDAETMAGIGDAKLVNSNNTVETKENESNNDNSKDENKSNSGDNSTIETAESEIESDNNSKASSVSTRVNSSSASSVSTRENNSSVEEKESNTKTTSGTVYSTDYFVSSRLERDKMYSQMLDTYQGLAENSGASPEQKNISTQEITNINNRKNSIMIAENLIKNLGFEDVVIFVNDNSTSVIIKAEKLSEADIAQIQNIVCREIGVSAEVIHISLK